MLTKIVRDQVYRNTPRNMIKLMQALFNIEEKKIKNIEQKLLNGF